MTNVGNQRLNDINKECATSKQAQFFGGTTPQYHNYMHFKIAGHLQYISTSMPSSQSWNNWMSFDNVVKIL